jgi:hypothetical protein
MVEATRRLKHVAPTIKSNFPFYRAHQKNKRSDCQEVNDCHHVVISDPVLIEPAPYHDAYIGKKKSKQNQNVIESRGIELHDFFFIGSIVCKKQYQVNKSQEKNKIDQIAYLNGNS